MASRSERSSLSHPRHAAALLGCAIAMTAALPAFSVTLESTLVSIGTGGKTGVYYLTGGAICDAVNAGRWDHGLRCLAEPSAGSIDNLRDIRAGERTFGIVQSDWQHHAVEGSGVFAAAGPDRELRSVFALFPEPFTVVARPDAEISEFADLQGKRVSLGPSGSGGRATMNVVMAAFGWTEADFAYVAEFAMGDLPRAICAGEIDAAVFIVAHPNLTVEDMAGSCDAVPVPVAGPPIEALIAENPYYTAFDIPASTYPGQPASVPTFALTATLVTSSRVAPSVVYQLTRAVFEDFDAFRRSHPALEELDEAQMTSEGLTAPLHPGALRYYEQVGLR